jgi:hypothetical protein
MVINIIIALLAFFLAGALPIIDPGLPAFFLWCVILFFVAGAGYAYSYPGEKKRWIF